MLNIWGSVRVGTESLPTWHNQPQTIGITLRIDGITFNMDGITPHIDEISPRIDAIRPHIDGIRPRIDRMSYSALDSLPEKT